MITAHMANSNTTKFPLAPAQRLPIAKMKRISMYLAWQASSCRYNRFSVTCNSGRLCFKMRIKHLSPERRGLDIHLAFFILNPDPANDGMPSKAILNPPVAPTCPKISLIYSATQQDRRALPQATVTEEGKTRTAQRKVYG